MPFKRFKCSNFSFTIHAELLRKIVYEVSMLDLEEPPKNKLRKVIFKYGNNDNETRIVFATLKPEGTVTTAPKYKE